MLLLPKEYYCWSDTKLSDEHFPPADIFGPAFANAGNLFWSRSDSSGQNSFTLHDNVEAYTAWHAPMHPTLFAEDFQTTLRPEERHTPAKVRGKSPSSPPLDTPGLLPLEQFLFFVR